MTDRLISDTLNRPDQPLDVTLRPQLFDDFTGQVPWTIHLCP